MEKRLVRSRGLLSIVALAVTAGLNTAPPAHATSSANAGRMSTEVSHGATATTAQCKFVSSLNTCVSTDPTVSYTSNAYGDTSGCIFVFDVTWGDGSSPTNVTFTDPTDGPHLVGNHKYAAPGVYTITVNVQVTAGTCTVTNSVHTFTLALLNASWTGYVTYVQPTIVNQVSGNWTVPDLHCNAFTYSHSVATWVGFGGTKSGQTLVQAGVLSQCNLGGLQNNDIVWQVLPPYGNVVRTGIPVSTGNKIYASVTESYESYTLEVRDTTSGKSFRKSYTLPAKSAIADSAEWIVEDPPGYSLASFGTITFTGCSYGSGGKDAPTTTNSIMLEIDTPSGNNPLVSPIANASFSVQYLRS